MTHYLSSWCEDIVLRTAERVGIPPKVFRGPQVTRQHVISNIDSVNSPFIFFNGHGSTKTIAGHKNEILIELGDNEHVLKDKVVHALACGAGKDLGKNCNAKAFIGYAGDFWLCMDRFSLSRPLEDKFATPIMLAAFEAPNQLVKGKTPKEAFELSQKKYQNWIDEFTYSESKYTTEELQLILPLLHINKLFQILHEK